MAIALEPIGFVEAARDVAKDDDWGATEATIVLAPELPEDSLTGLGDFSHVEVLFHFDKVPLSKITTGARHPRNNTAWPKVGIFAQRGKGRPNRLGSTICRVVRCEGRRLIVAELDAIDGTPVLDLKPVMREFQPRGAVQQPSWVGELMADYWNSAK